MKKDNFSVINYTDQEIPVFCEKQGQKFVTYGADDLYGDYLRDLFITSSTNGAIINGVADMIYGGGLDATDKDDSDGTREQWLRLQDLLRKSDEDLLQKVAFDIKLYGMTYVNVIWNASRTRIAQLKHLPVHTIRSGIADSEGVISEFYYKSDWRDKREVEKAIKAFSNEDRTTASTCFQIKRYTPSLHYYALPDYAGGNNYIELDQEISEFHLQGIRRGFFPSMLLSFKNGVPTQQERRVIEQKVIDKFTGADNAGRILITFNDGDETAPEFTPITQNGADGMYEYLSKLVSEKIITAHRVVSPLIFGVRSEGGGFGNNADELRDSYSLFNNTVVAPFQDILLNAFSKLFAINDIELDIFFITAKPADFLDLDVIDTLDEGVQQKEGIESEDGVDNPEQVEEVEEVAVTADNQASYNGAQITSALDIIVKVGEGLLTSEQAIVFLIQMLQFEPSVAEALFTEGKDAVVEVEAARFSKLSKKKQLKVADALIKLGEKEEDILKGYEMIDKRKVEKDTESVMDALFSFASVIPSTGHSGKGESEQDNELIKVRYRYAPDRNTHKPQRDFCSDMINAGLVYTKENIIAGFGANPGFGIDGAPTYDIWLYKGGPNCYHWFERVTYLQKNNKKITVTEARRLITSLPPSERDAVRIPTNDRKVAKRPRDMPNRGYYN